jgi:protein O-mannosyl-transferase
LPLLLCANTLIFLPTLGESHFGQQTFSLELLTNSSNSFPHFLQVYSKIGILILLNMSMSTGRGPVNPFVPRNECCKIENMTGEKNSKAMKAGLILVLVVISALPFIPGLDSPFFYDDHNTILMNPAIKSPEYGDYFHKLETFSADRARMFRPLVISSLALNWQISHDNPRGWHLTNLCAHLLAVVVVFLLIEALSGSMLLAFLTALLFGIHPSRVEPVIYISARSEIFASLFYMLSFWLFLKAGRAAKNSTWVLLSLFSLLGFWLGLLSKDIAITLPAVLTLERLVFKRLDKRSAYLLGAFWVSAGAYFLLRRSLDLATFFPAARPRPVLDNLLLQARVISYYLRFLVFPLHPAVDLDFGSAPLWQSISCAIFLVGVAALGILLWRKKPLISFFIFFFFIALSPSSSVVPLVVQGNINRVYMAGIAWFVIVAELIALSWKKNKLMAALIAAFIFLLLFAMSANWAGAWPSPTRLWRQTVKSFPAHSRGHNNLGLLLERGGNYAQAEREYEQAVAADPENASALDNYGRLLSEKGEASRAELFFKKSLSLEPSSCITSINYSQLLITQSRLEEAKELLDSVQFCPGYAGELARQRDRVDKLITH